jgi:hypothetical protein
MSNPTDVRLVLGGPKKGEVWVNGVNLANVVGTIALYAPPGGPPHLTMQLVPDRIHVQVEGVDVAYECAFCGRPMDPPEEP